MRLTLKEQANKIARLKRNLANTQHLIRKLKTIDILHREVHNVPLIDPDRLYAEFYYAVGDVLEGQEAKDLRLTLINKDNFLKELLDG